LRVKNPKPKLIILHPKVRIKFRSTFQRSRPKQKARRAQVGRLSERESSIITSKNKNKTKIKPKGKTNLNYRERNSKEAHQANDSSQK
jgi:hypothetical protein